MNLHHQVALGIDVVHLLQLDDLVLLHELHRVHVPVPLVLAILDAPEGSHSEGPYLILKMLTDQVTVGRGAGRLDVGEGEMKNFQDCRVGWRRKVMISIVIRIRKCLVRQVFKEGRQVPAAYNFMILTPKDLSRT